MWFLKRKKKEEVSNVVIKPSCYEKLPNEAKKHFDKVPSHVDVDATHQVVHNDDGDFALSMIMGMATDNAALGYISGGNLTGAIIGQELEDAMKSNDTPTQDYSAPDTGNDTYTTQDYITTSDSTTYDSPSSDSTSYDSGGGSFDSSF